MNIKEIYFSPTGGTKKVADAFCEFLAESGEIEKIDICPPYIERSEGMFDRQFEKDDIVVLAVPVYGGRVPQLALEYLSGFEGNGALAITIAVFGNRAFDDTLLEMNDFLTTKNFVCVASIGAIAEHAIIRTFASGRPDEDDMVELKAYSILIKEKLLGELDSNDIEAEVPGQRPYLPPSLIPLKIKTGTFKCKKCGTCAENCPTGAITTADVKKQDTEKCISCMRCIAVCPNGAKSLGGLLLNVATKKLEPLLGTRRDNQLYL